MKKRKGMSMLLVLTIVLLLSSCAADAGAEPQVESVGSFADPVDENVAAATALLDEAVERQGTILTSETKIVRGETLTPGKTYTGTAYYVSNKGNDGNDGRSPETAWATLDRVNEAPLQYGDAVFFERGGVWRNTTVETKEGVTYSAYGEGAKPRICASPETEEIRLSGPSGGRERTGRRSGSTTGICQTAAPWC